MINLDGITNKNSNKHNENWPYIPDHLYRILITGCSGSGKTIALLNLINEQNDIDKIYLCAKDLSEPKYEYLIKKRKNTWINYLNDSNALLSVLILWTIFMRILMSISQVEKKNFNLFWWHDCRHYDKEKI